MKQNVQYPSVAPRIHLWRLAVFCLGLLLLAGCRSIGPQSVENDRFNYNTAIANSWKEQTLLNIVKLRYADMPLFVEVASVVSGYTMERSVSLNGTLSGANAVQGDFIAMGGSGRFTDRPTITYTPLTGKEFNQNFLTPIPPQSLLFLIQSGWPADTILRLTADSINGLRSRSLAGVNAREGDPNFYRLIKLFRELQKSGAVGMRILTDENKKKTTLVFFHEKNMEPEQQENLKELQALMGVPPDTVEMGLSYGPVAQSNTEMAVMSRSMLQIIIELSAMIDVPQEHLEKGYTVAAHYTDNEMATRLFTVKCGAEKPSDAFVSIRYHDYWFWIENSDFKSKRTFAFVMILFSLTETGDNENLPVVTIPAG